MAKKCQIPWRPFFIWSCYKKTFTFSSTAAVSWIGTFLPDLYLIVFVFWASLHFLIIIMEKEAIQTLRNWTSILARKIYVWAHLKTLKATVDAFRNSTFSVFSEEKIHFAKMKVQCLEASFFIGACRTNKIENPLLPPIYFKINLERFCCN